MEIKKILICGSSYLTREVVNYIKPHYNLVGYIPSKSHVFSTNIDLPIVDFNVDYDLILSLQFDQKIKDTSNSFNLHTGLLPDWGGCDILYHTLKNKLVEQGLTFHKITDKFDEGPIISKISYPVFNTDNMIDLYHKIIKISPNFVLSALKLLETIKDVDNCKIYKPTLHKRGKIDINDLEMYQNFPTLLKQKY